MENKFFEGGRFFLGAGSLFFPKSFRGQGKFMGACGIGNFLIPFNTPWRLGAPNYFLFFWEMSSFFNFFLCVIVVWCWGGFVGTKIFDLEKI